MFTHFTNFFWWWKVGHGLGLGFWGCLWHNMDIALFEGGTWSRSSWQMPYSIHWCLGSYIGVWGSVMHLHTLLHCVCSISVFTTTTSVSMCVWHQLGPLQWVQLSTFHQCREFKVKGEKWVANLCHSLMVLKLLLMSMKTIQQSCSTFQICQIFIQCSTCQRCCHTLNQTLTFSLPTDLKDCLLSEQMMGMRNITLNEFLMHITMAMVGNT